MDAIILAKEDLDKIQHDLSSIKSQILKLSSPAEQILDNQAFVKLMGISTRTAQSWRDEGKIGFSQEGKKIYYRMSDIEKFLENTYRAPFQALRKTFS